MIINFSRTGTEQRDSEEKSRAYPDHNSAYSGRDFIEIFAKPSSLKFPIYHFYVNTGNKSELAVEEARMRFNAWATLILELLA